MFCQLQNYFGFFVLFQLTSNLFQVRPQKTRNNKKQYCNLFLRVGTRCIRIVLLGGPVLVCGSLLNVTFTLIRQLAEPIFYPFDQRERQLPLTTLTMDYSCRVNLDFMLN